MGILDRLFQKRKKNQQPTEIRFGRYSDAYKEADQYDLWDQALKLFEQKDYLSAYERFLQYLNDPSEENIHYTRSGTRIDFEIIQGSNKLVGYCDSVELRVETKIAKINNLTAPLLRHLLEYNYQLRYCRFGLTADNHISIIFDSSTIDGSPYKLYYALKEVANHADKKDDLLIHDFDSVEYTDQELLHHISSSQKTIKYNYLINAINKTLALIEPDQDRTAGYSGGKAYALLSLTYRLDYLIKPEGFLMERLEEINRTYFSNEVADIDDKIKMIQSEYNTILDHDSTILQSEMYWVKSTFGITVSVNHDRIVNFIDGELSNMDWYLENEHHDIAQGIPEYIIGYVLFHFAPPKPDRQLLQLYLRITEEQYFAQLGFSTLYNGSDGKYNRRSIKRAIGNVVDDNDSVYPYLDPKVSILRFGSRAAFAISYLKMIKQLDMTKKE